MPEFTFAGSGGHELLVHVWETPQTPRALVLLAHGFGEHAGRYDHVATALSAAGYLVIAPDHHGHGRSSGPRAQVSFRAAVADLDHVVNQQTEIHPGLPMFLLGHSMGGAIALRYAIGYQNRLAGLILSGPLVIVEAHPVAKLVGSLLARVLPGAPTIKLDPALVSRDPAVVAAYRSDPLVHHGAIPAVTASEFVIHASSIMRDASQITLPTLLLWGTGDQLCPPAGAEAVAKCIASSDLTLHAYPGLYHEILNEPEQAEVLDAIIDWLDQHVPAPV
jgi:alpha-beta hydrolase superfamily lysophospholipase